MKTALKVLSAILVLAIGAGGAALMYSARPRPTVEPPEPFVPLVRHLEVTLVDVRMTVRSQGTVSPRTEITIAPEVAGVVVEVSPSLTAGGFFEKDEMLLRIDPRDFELEVERARAEVARAGLRLAEEQAEAEVARREWEELGTGEGTPLSLREPQLAEARAALAAAGAALEKAERDLDRSRLTAPFAGRVRSRDVDVGQFVSRGNPVARIYAVDHAEVRLPLEDSELAYLDLPLDYRGETRGKGPAVTVRASFAGRTHEWRGRIVRTEGEVDPRSRMVFAVARVEDPYGRGDDPDRPPLAVGLFVEAEIEGRLFRDTAVLPRTAMRDADVVLVIESEVVESGAGSPSGPGAPDRLVHRLRRRRVEAFRRDRERVYVRSGLAAGERVCLSMLEAAVDGMRVRIEEPPSPHGADRASPPDPGGAPGTAPAATAAAGDPP